MKQYIVANPPCGIYKGDLPLGYAYYQTLLDIHSRFLRESKGLEVLCPKYSLNALGKRAEDLGLDGTLENLDEYVQSFIESGRLRDRMNFSFSGNILDTSEESIEQTTETFRRLYEKGYVLKKGSTFYLDTKKIGEDFDLEGISQDINFFSDRIRGEFTRLIQDSSNPIRITKERVYSVPNPFGDEGIAPIFGVSNLWEGYFDKEIDFMAASEKELTRYLMLRFLSQVPISQNLPMKNILVYNYIEPEGGFDIWEMEGLTETKADSDALRYSFARSFSSSKQKTKLQRDFLNRGRKLVHLTENLQRVFSNEGLRFSGFSNIDDAHYIEEMNNFRYSQILEELERKLRDVSNGVSVSRSEGDFDSEKEKLFGTYLTLVKGLTPFCPFTSEKVISDLSNK